MADARHILHQLLAVAIEPGRRVVERNGDRLELEPVGPEMCRLVALRHALPHPHRLFELTEQADAGVALEPLAHEPALLADAARCKQEWRLDGTGREQHGPTRTEGRLRPLQTVR